MSGGQFQTERDYYRLPQLSVSSRAWVKRELEFWHYYTIDSFDGDHVTFSINELDQITVSREQVRQIELKPGDLVFREPYRADSLYGEPAAIVSIDGEMAELEFVSDHRRDRGYHLSGLRLYADLALPTWQKGTPVFAYKFLEFNPPLFLYFPAKMLALVRYHCVEVEFDDGSRTILPTTLVEARELTAGEVVYTCTVYGSFATLGRESWEPCGVVANHGEYLLVQDARGGVFNASINFIGVLPRGYQMFDGRFKKIPTELTGQSIPSPADVHIIRTDDWRTAADNPITKDEVDRLVGMDVELDWGYQFASSSNRVLITWKRQACFWWCENDIRCTSPTEGQLAKMIQLAIRLDANVIGNDGHEYH